MRVLQDRRTMSTQHSRNLDQYRKFEVTYPLIEECYDAYKIYFDSGKKNFEQREKCVLIGLSLLNLFVTKALERYSIDVDQLKMEEIVGEGTLVLIESIDTKEFPNVAAFYSYLKLRLTGVVYNYLRETAASPLDISDIAALRDTSIEEIENSVDYEILTDVYLRSCLKKLLRRFPEEEAKAIQYIVRSKIDESIKCNQFILTARYGIKKNRFTYLVEVSDLILRLILLSHKDNYNIKDYMSTTKEKVELDKFYCLLLLLDPKYPFLPELYGLLGDRLFSLMTVMEGKTLKLPSIDEFRKMHRNLSVYLDVLRDEGEENRQRVADRYGISIPEVIDIVQNCEQKLGSLLNAKTDPT
jgi:hypothetical protein